MTVQLVYTEELMGKSKKKKKNERRMIIPWCRWETNNVLTVQWQGYSEAFDNFGQRLLVFKVINGSVSGFPTRSGQTICLYSTKLLKEQIRYINKGVVISINYGGLQHGEQFDYHLIRIFTQIALRH